MGAGEGAGKGGVDDPAELHKVVTVDVTDAEMELALRAALAVLLNGVLTSIDAGDYKRAHGLVGEAERIAPANAKVYYRRSQILEAEGRLAEAIGAADKACRLSERESGGVDEGARARVATLKRQAAEGDRSEKELFRKVFVRQANERPQQR